jgi:hypothetical protein
VFIPFYSAGFQIGLHFELAVVSLDRGFFLSQYKVSITILFLQVSKLGYILNSPLFKLDYTKLLSVINYINYLNLSINLVLAIYAGTFTIQINR